MGTNGLNEPKGYLPRAVDSLLQQILRQFNLPDEGRDITIGITMDRIVSLEVKCLKSGSVRQFVLTREDCPLDKVGRELGYQLSKLLGLPEGTHSIKLTQEADSVALISTQGCLDHVREEEILAEFKKYGVRELK